MSSSGDGPDWSQQWPLPAEPQRKPEPGDDWLRPAGSGWQPPPAWPPPQPPQQPAKPPPAPRPQRVRKPRPGLTRALIAGGVAVVLAGGATGAIVLAQSNLLPAPAPAPPSPKPSPTKAQPVDITSRVRDPRPFTAAGLFPQPAETISGRSYRLLGSEALGNCATAANGTAVTTLVQRGCNQVVRGTWQDSGGRYVITVGLANLPTTGDAQQVIAVLRDPKKGVFLPYAVAGGPAASFDGRGPTLVGWQAQGHYLVFSVATSANLADPGLKQATADLRGVVSNALLKRAVGG